MEKTNKKLRIRMNPKIEEVAYKILEKNKTPMNYKVLTNEIMKIRPIGGKTPQDTVYSILLRSKKISIEGRGFFSIK